MLVVIMLRLFCSTDDGDDDPGSAATGNTFYPGDACAAG